MSARPHYAQEKGSPCDGHYGDIGLVDIVPDDVNNMFGSLTQLWMMIEQSMFVRKEISFTDHGIPPDL